MPLMRHKEFPGQTANVSRGAVEHMRKKGWREVKPRDQGAELAEHPDDDAASASAAEAKADSKAAAKS